MNVVGNSPHTEAFAFGVASNGGEICMKLGANIGADKGMTIFRAENQMNQNKGEGLGYRVDYKSGFQPSRIVRFLTWGCAPGWYGVAPLALLFVMASAFVPEATYAQHAPTPAKTQQHMIRIRIINAQTNKPIHDEKLNVALKTDQIGSVAKPTDKNGIIEVDTGDATIIRILSNMYADCRPRGELYTNYSIAEIRSHGITTGNLCSAAHPNPRPGELILFEIPKTFVPQYPKPPVTHLPHSGEYPN